MRKFLSYNSEEIATDSRGIINRNEVDISYALPKEYLISYKQSFLTLIDKAIAENDPAYIYVLCFLFRQYIELILSHIMRYKQHSDKAHHNIIKQWGFMKTFILNRCGVKEEDKAIFDSIIEQLGFEDSKFAFRYWMNHDANESTIKNDIFYNYQSMKENFIKIDTYLQGIYLEPLS